MPTETRPSPNGLPLQSPENIRTARVNAGLTQQEAAELVHRADSARWREWESGRHRMDSSVWELFLLKTGQRKLAKLPKGLST
jgi:DNA-binding transcriptional regulator YiaG